jgi:hypothetical protein
MVTLKKRLQQLEDRAIQDNHSCYVLEWYYLTDQERERLAEANYSFRGMDFHGKIEI